MRRVAAPLALAAALLALAACGGDDDNPATSDNPGGTHTVVHAQGETEVPDDPQRIAGLAEAYDSLSQIAPTVSLTWEGTGSWRSHVTELADALGRRRSPARCSTTSASHARLASWSPTRTATSSRSAWS